MYFKTASNNPGELSSKAPFYSTFLHLSDQRKNTVKVHRVFPSRCFFPVSAPGVPNSLGYYKRTVWKSLSRFMHVGTYPTRNFRYLRTCQGYGCLVVCAICSFLSKLPLTKSNPWQASDILFPLSRSQRPVFLLNKSPPRL